MNKYLIPVLFYLLVYVDNIYGFTHKPRECKKKTLTTELVHLFHILIITYSMMSPFILKDYISNFMFNTTMMVSWFMTRKLKKQSICALSVMEGVLCENDEPIREVPPYYINLATAMVVYDVYMMFKT